MWPFNKKIAAPVSTVENQLAVAIKSLSMPQAMAKWTLHPQSEKQWDTQAAIDEGYNASAIVYASVEKRAKLLASIPWKAYIKDAKGELTEQPNSALQQLINRPNPDYSWYELIYKASQNLDLAGHSFISEIKAGAKDLPVALWVLPSQGMKIKPSQTETIEYYEYNKHRIETSDMIMLKMPNPNSPWFGMPVLMAAGKATDIDRESGIWQKVSLENRGASDINIKVPDTATQEQVNNVKDQYKKQQSGSKNARKAMVTSADIQMLGQNAIELDFINSRRAIWTEICAVFGLSLSNLGMTEDVNLANADAMNKALWQNTIIPQLELISRQMNHQLASEFGPEWVMVPDLTNIEALQENKAEKLVAAQALYSMGVPFNVISAKLELGIEEIEGGNIGYISSGMIPANFDFDNTDIGDDGGALSGQDTNGQ